MYEAISYENSKLDWLSKHLMEVFIGLVLAFMVWEASLLLELKNGQTINNVRIQHIDEAVNNVGAGEKTLRELVVETRQDVETLKQRSELLLRRNREADR